MLDSPMHPGEFLNETYLKPLKISVSDAAKNIGVNKSTLSRLINGKQDLTCEMAVRLSKFLGNSTEQWMNLQLNFSIERAYENINADTITPADIEKAVSDAWQKELDGKAVYLSNEEVSNLMQKKLAELRSRSKKSADK